MSNAEILAFSHLFSEEIQQFSLGSPELDAKLDSCVKQLMDKGKSESSAYAICTASIKRKTKNKKEGEIVKSDKGFTPEEVVLAYELGQTMRTADDILQDYENIYTQLHNLRSQKIESYSDVDEIREKIWPLESELYRAEGDFKRRTNLSKDEAEAALLKIRLRIQKGTAIEIFEKRGPGGHTPDGTGPHGRGMGPGKGKADGSGMENDEKKKKKKKVKPGSLKGGKNQPTKKPGQKKAPKAGSGERFQELKDKLGKQKGVKDSGALAAALGRAKFGKKKMSQMAAKGKKS